MLSRDPDTSRPVWTCDAACLGDRAEDAAGGQGALRRGLQKGLAWRGQRRTSAHLAAPDRLGEKLESPGAQAALL